MEAELIIAREGGERIWPSSAARAGIRAHSRRRGTDKCPLGLPSKAEGDCPPCMHGLSKTAGHVSMRRPKESRSRRRPQTRARMSILSIECVTSFGHLQEQAAVDRFSANSKDRSGSSIRQTETKDLRRAAAKHHQPPSSSAVRRTTRHRFDRAARHRCPDFASSSGRCRSGGNGRRLTGGGSVAVFASRTGMVEQERMLRGRGRGRDWPLAAPGRDGPAAGACPLIVQGTISSAGLAQREKVPTVLPAIHTCVLQSSCVLAALH